MKKQHPTNARPQTGLRLQLGPVLDWVDKKVPVPSIGWHPQPFDGTESFYSFRKGCTLEKRMKLYSMKIVRVSARTIGLNNMIRHFQGNTIEIEQTIKKLEDN